MGFATLPYNDRPAFSPGEKGEFGNFELT